MTAHPVYFHSDELPTETAEGLGYLYVVAKAIDGPIKVGMATDVRRRVKDLEGANGARFPLIWASDLVQNVRDAEQRAHRILADFRGVGEWFDLSFEIALVAAKTATSKRPLSRRRCAA